MSKRNIKQSGSLVYDRLPTISEVNNLVKMDNFNLQASKGLNIISGPTNSGKSQWAEKLTLEYSSVAYIATGKLDCQDKEWIARIEKHKERRPKAWNTLEVCKL